jgi:hypothetical protein
MLLLYRPLNFNHHAIQQQLAYLALSMDLVHNPTTLIDNPIDRTVLDNEVPLLKNFLTAYNLTLARANFSVLRENGDTGIYLDQTIRWAKIEIPVLGCDYAYTAYYNAKVKEYNRLSTGVLYWQYDADTARELDRFTLTRPTVINVQVPRRTQITRVHVRRISLVLDVGIKATDLLAPDLVV